MNPTIEPTPQQAAAADLERARHLDRYAEVNRQSSETLEDLAIGEQHDLTADAHLQRALRNLSIFRAQALSDDARHLAAVVMDDLGTVAAREHLERMHVYGTAAQRQETIVTVARQGAAACEASR